MFREACRDITSAATLKFLSAVKRKVADYVRFICEWFHLVPVKYGEALRSVTNERTNGEGI